MSDSDKSESESEQPSAKKTHYNILSNYHSQQSSQWSQNIIIETGHHEEQLNTRHTIDVIVNNNKKERQKRYREKHREKLKQLEAERRKRIHYLQSTAGPSTSSNTTRINLNNDETIAAISQSSSGLENTRTASIQINEHADEINALQKNKRHTINVIDNNNKKKYQTRYREQNREKLKQLEAERRKRIHYLQSTAGPSTSSNTTRINLNNDETIAAISQSSSGLENTRTASIQINEHADEINALQKNKRHTINVIDNNNKKKYQTRYREQNREKLKQLEAERRKRIHYLQSTAGPSTSSNTTRINLNNEETVASISQSSSGLEKTRTASIQINEHADEMNALQKNKKRQQKYREQNRDKLRQREAERRRRLRNAEMITEVSNCLNIELTEIIDEPIINYINTDSQCVAGFGEMQHLVDEVSQRNLRDQSSEGAEMLTAVVKVERDATGGQCESATSISCKEEPEEGAEMLTAVVKVEHDATDDQCESATAISYKKEAEEGAEMLTVDVKVERDAMDDQCQSATAISCKKEANDYIFIKWEPGTDATLIKEELEINQTVIQPKTMPHSQLNITETDTSSQPLSSLNTSSTSTALHYDVPGRPTSSTPRAEKLVLAKSSFISDVSHDFTFESTSSCEKSNKQKQHVDNVATLATTSPTNIHKKTNKQMDKCAHCDYSASGPSELGIHNCIHTGKRPYKCEHCDYSASLRSILRRHMRIHTGERPYKCEHCDYSATHHRTLQTHMRTHTGERPYKCEHCDYSASQPSNLQSHMRVHTGERPYKCEYCDYSASVRSAVRTHMRIHTRERPYKCEHCDYSASQRSNLQRHTRVHTGERPYKCEHCDYSASEHGSLQMHVRIHTGKKPYKCKYCDYSATQRASLQTHIHTHTGERPYKCKQCDYSASHRTNLRKHMLIHTGEKPHKCEYCDYSASVRSAVKTHMRIHTGERPYKCEQCDYSASLRSNLQNHMRTHTKETPYKCEYCDYSASQSSSLQKHMRIHTEETPYKCEHCDFRASDRRPLINHMRTHT